MKTPLVPVAVLCRKSYWTLVPPLRLLISIGDVICCAERERQMTKEKIAAATMMGSRVIKRGKLIRTQLACQAGFPRENFCANDCGISLRCAKSQWHVNCEQLCRIERMATKIKMMKLLTEADALTEVDRVPP